MVMRSDQQSCSFRNDPKPFRHQDPMLKHLLRSLPFLLIGLQTNAQQPADCSNCACAIPSSGMLGTTLTSAGTQPACDPNMPEIYSLDVNKYGRFWAEPEQSYTISLCANDANTMLYVTTNTTIPG